MVLYLPHYSGDKWFPEPEDHTEPHRVGPDALERYSRIVEIFNVGDCYDLKDKERRKELVSKIYANIEQKTKNPWFSSSRMRLGS